MYSVIECGGFQHKVTVGERLRLQLPKLEAKVGEIITAPKVLLFANGDTIKVGAPVVAGASVKMEVLGHDREDKVLIFKRKRRKRYRLLKGHRQHYTEVLVTEIALGGDKASVDEKAKVRARARSKALAAAKVQNVPLTRAQKVAAQAKEGK
jgi:ribosomal protein L21